MITLYYKIIALIAMITIWVGFILPYLISAKDDVMVIAGIVITVILVPLVVTFTINIVQNLIKIASDNAQKKGREDA